MKVKKTTNTCNFFSGMARCVIKNKFYELRKYILCMYICTHMFSLFKKFGIEINKIKILIIFYFLKNLALIFQTSYQENFDEKELNSLEIFLNLRLSFTTLVLIQ